MWTECAGTEEWSIFLPWNEWGSLGKECWQSWLLTRIQSPLSWVLLFNEVILPQSAVVVSQGESEKDQPESLLNESCRNTLDSSTFESKSIASFWCVLRNFGCLYFDIFPPKLYWLEGRRRLLNTPNPLFLLVFLISKWIGINKRIQILYKNIVYSLKQHYVTFRVILRRIVNCCVSFPDCQIPTLWVKVWVSSQQFQFGDDLGMRLAYPATRPM